MDESATGKEVITESVEEHVASTQPKRAAKIHDFCFGIPYGTFCDFLSELDFKS